MPFPGAADTVSGVGSAPSLTVPRDVLPTEQFGGGFGLVKNDINQNIEVRHLHVLRSVHFLPPGASPSTAAPDC